MSIDKVIEILSNVNPDDFNMDISSTCISGQIHKHLHPHDEGFVNVVDTFERFTGLDTETSKLATFPAGESNPAWQATPDQAIKMLEILRDEGVVDWERAIA